MPTEYPASAMPGEGIATFAAAVEKRGGRGMAGEGRAGNVRAGDDALKAAAAIRSSTEPVATGRGQAVA